MEEGKPGQMKTGIGRGLLPRRIVVEPIAENAQTDSAKLGAQAVRVLDVGLTPNVGPPLRLTKRHDGRPRGLDDPARLLHAGLFSSACLSSAALMLAACLVSDSGAWRVDLQAWPGQVAEDDRDEFLAHTARPEGFADSSGDGGLLTQEQHTRLEAAQAVYGAKPTFIATKLVQQLHHTPRRLIAQATRIDTCGLRHRQQEVILVKGGYESFENRLHANAIPLRRTHYPITRFGPHHIDREVASQSQDEPDAVYHYRIVTPASRGRDIGGPHDHVFDDRDRNKNRVEAQDFTR
jgi:hypothetical protein